MLDRRTITAVLVVACVFVVFPTRCEAQLPNASSANTSTSTPAPLNLTHTNTSTSTPAPTPPPPNASSANTSTSTPATLNLTHTNTSTSTPAPTPPPPSALDADAGSAGLLLLQFVANVHVIEGHFDAPRRRLYQAAIAVVLKVPPDQVLIARVEPIAHQERRADTHTLAVFTEVYVRTRAPFPLLETEILNSLLASSGFQVTSIVGVTVTDLPRDYNGSYTVTTRVAARSTLAEALAAAVLAIVFCLSVCVVLLFVRRSRHKTVYTIAAGQDHQQHAPWLYACKQPRLFIVHPSHAHSLRTTPCDVGLAHHGLAATTSVL